MNNRINELAEQANELDYETFDNYNHKTVRHYKFNKEKFAQLIVRECVTICQYNADDDDDQFDLGRVHKAKEITHLITTHFGVEL